MAIPLIPTTATLDIPATFSPPTTCFPSVPAPTYTLGGGHDSTVNGRLVIRLLETQCYPPQILGLGKTNTVTSTDSSGQVQFIFQPTATYFSATACPSGFMGFSGGAVDSLSYVHCCPSGPFALKPVDTDNYSGCVQTPTVPVTLVNGTFTTTLETPSTTPYGISYRPLEIVIRDDQASNTSSNSGLSDGAKAGIGVGVTLGVLALLLLGGFAWWRRRRRRLDQLEKDPAVAEVPGDSRAFQELDHNEILEAGHQHQLDNELKEQRKAASIVELEGDFNPQEAPVREKPSELPADNKT